MAGAIFYCIALPPEADLSGWPDSHRVNRRRSGALLVSPEQRSGGMT
jgi:hypothetical protein